MTCRTPHLPPKKTEIAKVGAHARSRYDDFLQSQICVQGDAGGLEWSHTNTASWQDLDRKNEKHIMNIVFF